MSLVIGMRKRFGVSQILVSIQDIFRTGHQ